MELGAQRVAVICPVEEQSDLEVLAVHAGQGEVRAEQAGVEHDDQGSQYGLGPQALQAGGHQGDLGVREGDQPGLEAGLELQGRYVQAASASAAVIEV